MNVKILKHQGDRVICISIMVINDTYRRDFCLSTIGAMLVEVDKEYFGEDSIVVTLIKMRENGTVFNVRSIIEDVSTLGLIPFELKRFDLMDPKYKSFLDALDLTLEDVPVDDSNYDPICLP